MCGKIIERLVSQKGKLTVSRAFVCTCDTLGIRDRAEVDVPSHQSYMRDDEVREALRDYDDAGFDDLPSWLKLELRVRGLRCEPREPTEQEKRETEADAFIHRVTNKQLTIQDHYDMIINQKGIFNV